MRSSQTKQKPNVSCIDDSMVDNIWGIQDNISKVQKCFSYERFDKERYQSFHTPSNSIGVNYCCDH